MEIQLLDDKREPQLWRTRRLSPSLPMVNLGNPTANGFIGRVLV